MGTTIIPIEQLRVKPPRAVCPSCNKHRYWRVVSGLESNIIMGRFVVVECKTCGQKCVWSQS